MIIEYISKGENKIQIIKQQPYSIAGYTEYTVKCHSGNEVKIHSKTMSDFQLKQDMKLLLELMGEY